MLSLKAAVSSLIESELATSSLKFWILIGNSGNQAFRKLELYKKKLSPCTWGFVLCAWYLVLCTNSKHKVQRKVLSTKYQAQSSKF